MKHLCAALIRETMEICSAPAYKLYGRVWLCDVHHEQANWRGDDGFIQDGGACVAFTTTDSGEPMWTKQYDHT